MMRAMSTGMRHTERAGGIVIDERGRVALVKRRPGTDWFFPKGGVEAGEAPEDAARREIEEETGLTELEYLDDLGSYERPGIKKEGTYDEETLNTIHMFLFASERGKEPEPSHEVLDAIWMPYREVAESLEDAKDRAWFTTVYERVREAVQRD